MDGRRNASYVLLISAVALSCASVVFLINVFTSKISLLSSIGLFSAAILLLYASIELFFFFRSTTGKKPTGCKEERIRKPLSVFLAIFAFTVLAAGLYPPFADDPVETVFLLLAFSYAVSEIVNYFLWAGNDRKDACDQPVRLSVIMALFVLMVFMMAGILLFMHPGASPAADADEIHATTFITHPTEEIESASAGEIVPDEAPAAGTFINTPTGVGDAPSAGTDEYGEEPASGTVIETHLAEDTVDAYADACVEAPVKIQVASGGLAGPVALSASAIKVTGGPDGDGVVGNEVVSPPMDDQAAAEPEQYYFQDLNDDFWADFYIAGETELELFDGTYYMELYVNGTYFGDVETISTSGVITINASELDYYLQDVLTGEALSRLALHGRKHVDAAYMAGCGVICDVDTGSFRVNLTFNLDDMPVQVISIAGSSSRMSSRPFGSGMVLEPAVFVLLSDYRLSSYFDLNPLESFSSSLSFYFSSYNKFRILGTEGTFSYSFSFSPTDFRFHFNSYQIHRDFREHMLRLSFGNVSTSLLTPNGTAVGLSLVKSAAYADPNARKKSNYEQVLVVEKESDVKVLNEGKEIYHKTLAAGKYRLQDFILYTGANRIKIVVTPLDGSPAREIDVDINYSYSLLNHGEVYYGVSLTAGRHLVKSSDEREPWELRIPYFDERSIEYDFSNFVLSGYIQAGLSRNISLDASFAFGNRSTPGGFFNPKMKLALEMTHANILGTTKYNLNISGDYTDGIWSKPGIYARLSHQVSLGIKALNSLNFAITYQSPSDMGSGTNHRIYISSAFAGRLGIASWSLGLNSVVYTDYPDRFTWGASLSAGFTLSRNLYLSFSGGLNGVALDSMTATGRVSATLSFGASRANINYSNNYASSDFSIYGDRYSLTAGARTADVSAFEEYDFDASVAYSGDMFGLNFSLDAYDSFNRIRGNASVSTGTVFADGLFTISNHTPSDFILVKQEKGLKGNKLTVGSIGYSNAEEVPVLFSTGLYTGISRDKGTSLSFNSYNESSFSMGTTVDVNIPASGRYGYTLRMSGEEKYSVSGIVVLPGFLPWINGSSPLYEVDQDFALVLTDGYVFTDDEGRFITTDLDVGTYGFDVDVDGTWYLYTFAVTGDFDSSMIYVFDKGGFEDASALPAPYGGLYRFEEGMPVGDDAFWEMLYPDVWGDV